MTPAEEVLIQVRLAGCELRPVWDGDGPGLEMRYVAPGEPDNEALERVAARARAHKQELLDLLLDPRPDLKQDHDAWKAVLLEAARLDPHPGESGSLYGLLHGLRCCGARLEWRKGHLFLNIRPVLEAGWTEDALRREWLLPRTEEIKAVFEAAEARLRGEPAVLPERRSGS